MRQPAKDAASPETGADEVATAPIASLHQRATARARVVMSSETAQRVARSEIAKGDVLGTARIAGIQAAKQTAELIPAALPSRIGGVGIEFVLGQDQIEIEARVDATDGAGVSMEALTACAVAALTIYDMCKAIDRSMTINGLALVEATTGDEEIWSRAASDEATPGH